jgi:coenzyme PQQ biosynthesis enzyme PqqE
MDRPLGLLAELTYSCPLACPYCSNPLNLGDYHDELTTAEWQRVLGEAQELGVLQLHLSGGEPLLRRDVVEIVNTANELGLYTNLITSAIGLSRRRAEQLRAAGLDHVQISIQADEPAVSDRIAGTPSFERKVEAARVVKELGWPLTLNVVLHRQNIDRVADLLRLAEEVKADRVELANTQYYGWALRNRDALLPSKAQLERAETVVRAARVRLVGRTGRSEVTFSAFNGPTFPPRCAVDSGAHSTITNGPAVSGVSEDVTDVTWRCDGWTRSGLVGDQRVDRRCGGHATRSGMAQAALTRCGLPAAIGVLTARARRCRTTGSTADRSDPPPGRHRTSVADALHRPS